MARTDTASIIKRILAVAVILIIIGYAIFSSRLFIEGPQIIIDSPKDGDLIIDNPLVTIYGKALNISQLELDGRPIYIEENGDFSESLLLDSGYNIIQVTAKDRFGRSVEQDLRLVFSGNESSSPLKATAGDSEQENLPENLDGATTSLENI